jgi:hypothetical protein
MAVMVRDRFAVTAVRALVVALATATLVACDVQPSPTALAPAAGTRVEVVYENHSDEPYVVSIVGPAPEQQGFASVDPCSTNAMSISAEPPFEIGVGQMRGDLGPQPVIANADDFDEPENGLYRYFIRIDADGGLTSGVLLGNQEFGLEPVC